MITSSTQQSATKFGVAMIFGLGVKLGRGKNAPVKCVGQIARAKWKSLEHQQKSSQN